MIKYEFFKNQIIIILFSLSIFLSYVSVSFLEFRFIYLLVFIFLITDSLILKKIQFNILAISIVIPILIFAYSFLFSYINFNEKNFIEFINLPSTNVFLIKIFSQSTVIGLTIMITYYYRKFLLSNIFKIIDYFVFIFIILIFIFYLKNPGVISDTLYRCDLGFFYSSRFLFSENSHFAIISVPVIASFIYNIKYYLKNYFFLIFYLLYLIFTLGSFSLTFYLSMLSAILIIFITIKNMNKISIYLFLLLALVLNAFMFLDIGLRGFVIVEEIDQKIYNKEEILLLSKSNEKLCMSNATSIANKIFLKKGDDSELKKYDNYKKLPTDNIEVKFDGLIQSKKNKLQSIFKKDNTNLSSGIYIYSLYVAKKSIIDNPFGVGINNYKKYRTVLDKTLKNIYQEDYKNLGGKIIFEESYMPSLTGVVVDLNNSSGSNNFSKLIVEFGLISALGLLLIFIFSFRKELDDSIKIIFIPMLFTQCFIRGTGYFYSGFLITLTIVLIVILGVIIKKYENKISK